MIAGIALALAASAVFLRAYPRDRIPERDRRLAPIFALGTMAIIGLGVACFWIVYELTGRR